MSHLVFDQGDGTTEYIIEAPCLGEMTSWLHELRSCIAPAAPPHVEDVAPETYGLNWFKLNYNIFVHMDLIELIKIDGKISTYRNCATMMQTQ